MPNNVMTNDRETVSLKVRESERPKDRNPVMPNNVMTNAVIPNAQ